MWSGGQQKNDVGLFGGGGGMQKSQLAGGAGCASSGGYGSSGIWWAWAWAWAAVMVTRKEKCRREMGWAGDGGRNPSFGLVLLLPGARWEGKRSSFDGAARASVMVLCWAEVASPLSLPLKTDGFLARRRKWELRQPGRATLLSLPCICAAAPSRLLTSSSLG